MIAPAVTCRLADPADLCAYLMKQLNIGFLPVVDDEGRLAAVVTDRDLATRVLGSGRGPSTAVSAVATRPVLTCRADDELSLAEEALAHARVDRLVVVEDDRPVGVVSVADLAEAEDASRFSFLYREIVTRETASPIPAGFAPGPYAGWLI
jgi:CBS domain-containing protein